MIKLGKSGTNPNNLISSSGLGQQLHDVMESVLSVTSETRGKRQAGMEQPDLCTSQWPPLQF